MSTKTEATVEDLSHVEGKAELVNGEIILTSPTGSLPSYAAREILISLRESEKQTKRGYAVSEVNTMKFFEGAPAFAVEVRSEADYGRRKEKKMAEKRADCFSAGTLVVWDVDLLSDDVVRVYRAGEPEKPTVYRRGEVAEAEPALPGWTLALDDLFL